MILSKYNGLHWREQIITKIACWLARAFPNHGQKRQFVPRAATAMGNQTQHCPAFTLNPAGAAGSDSAIGTHAMTQPLPSLRPKAKAAGPDPRIVKQDIPPCPETPLEWFNSLPPEMSLVIYIDQSTAQIMELLAVSRRHAADLFRVPMYAGKGTRWQQLGQFRMRRTEFEPARIFQQQEDALGELEGLLSARWYSSTELATLDQSILTAFEAACQPEPECAEGAPTYGIPVAANAITHLRELLQSRKVVSAEAERIDAALISAFQKVGVALPSQSPPPT